VFTLNSTESFGRSLFESEDWQIDQKNEKDSPEVHYSLIAMMYFTLTALATVGYGEYHPSSVCERMAFSLIMLAGATFYSVLLNNFI
jgi:hypothetical protein